MTMLLMSSRQSEDNQALWRAAIQRGWSVERAQGLRVPEIADDEIILYMESLFAQTIADRLGLQLLEPPVDWLVNLPEEYRKRKIGLTSLGELRSVIKPMFVKPPNEKLFTAKVYATGAELPTDFEDHTQVLAAEPVVWNSEFRCFCLSGRVRTVSPYSRNGVHALETKYEMSKEELTQVTTLVERLLATSQVETPNAIVIDAGEIQGKGWAIVEANGAWGSGIYGCDPDVVLDVIRDATLSQK